MPDDKKKDPPFQENGNEQEDDLPVGKKPVDAEDELKEEEGPESDTEEPQSADAAAVSGDTPAESPGEWFVDFDVWEATLEAHFGPDFEQVLSGELGPDWVMKLNNRINEEKNFYRVVDEIKSEIQGSTEEEVNNSNISFEALEPGEVIYDPTVVGPIGPGGGRGGGGGGQKKLPNLTDLRRKEFETSEEIKESIPPKSFERELIEDKDTPVDENLVLMERSEFSKMSYFAHKEIERHKDDLKLKEVLKREVKEEQRKRATPANRLLAAISIVVFLYAIFSVVSYSLCRFHSRSLLSSLPPDFHFQPSTSLHKQGMLCRVSHGDLEREESPLVLYFLRPKIKRLELNYPMGSINETYRLTVSNPTLLVIPQAQRGDSVVVQKHYRQFWPTNLGALTATPLLSLTENGQLVLSAYETTSSSLLPGLTILKITDSQNQVIGTAYVASETLNIRIESLEELPQQQTDLLNTRLVLLFSLLSI
jgi:hypothetical protein